MDLPVEVLANITALVSPPFYPPEIYDRPSLTASRSTSTSIKSASVSRSPFTPRSISSTSEDDTEKKADEAPKLIYLPPPPHIIENLDPFPQPAYTPVNTVAAISRASHRLLEASRPWLWEHVDVRSGRGWLAIVDALTEEVVDHIEVPTESILHRHLVGLGLDQGQLAPATPLSPQGNGILLPSEPVTAAEAHAQPITVPGGYAHYVSPPGSATYPSPYSVIGNGAGSSSAGPSNLNIPYIPHDDQRYAYSPPQPPSAALLLTPPGSRGGSPQPQFRKPLPIATILQQSKMPAGLSLSPNRASDIPALGRPLSAGILENGNRFDAEFASNTESSQRPASPSLLQTPVSATGSGFGTGPGSAGPSKILQLSEAALNSLSSNTPTKSPTTATSINARLRGRSRSPRRSIGFKTEGISAVLDRSRSSSAQGLQRSASSGGSWPRRIPLERRRSSLSRHRTMSDSGLADDDDEDEEDNNADEAEDDVPDLVPTASKSTLMGKKRQRHVPFTPPSSTAAHNDLPDSDDEAMEDDHSDLLPPPGPYIRHLSFNDFRTIGSRRTQDEAVRGRFVTAGRLEGVIKNAPNLISLCMTEYVDSSLSFPVLEDILFRGYRKPRAPRRPSFAASLSRTRSISVDPNPSFSPMTTTSQLDPPRPTYVPYEDETEEERWRRRSMFTPLEALDLTGCVSGVFTSAMKEFWDTWMLNREEDESEHGRGRSRNGHRLGSASDIAASSTEDEEEGPSSGYHRTNRSTSSRRKPRFAAMRRLSLRACTTLDPPLLQDLVLAFPSLTHLDLSNTRVPSTLLAALTDAPPKTLRLQSLSLARCTRLEPSVLVEFLVQSPVVQDLVELNLYVNPTGGMAMTSNDLHRFLTAPCVKSGRLRYLDISSSGLTPAHLQPGVFPAQPSLLSLGLSYMPSLALQPIADFLFTQAPNVEILTLTGTAVESALNPSHSSLDVTLKLHAHLINPLTTVPFSLASLNLGAGGSFGPNLQPGATHLRVIELSSPVRKIIADGGTGEWKVVRSKGGRGWYVDLSAGWTPDGFVRHLPASHPRRQWLASLAKAEGRVGSSVGWHGRKMEVIRGLGMLGREGGMAGVGGYAFEE